MKGVNVTQSGLDPLGVPRVSATITPDVGAAYTVTNLGPAPIYDAKALWNYLAAYDAAYQAGLVQAAQGAPVTGALTAPV